MSFQEIRGLDRSVKILQKYIKESHLPNAYLFIGPDGIGKKIVAKTFSKALNCENELLDSCDTCASCLKIENGQHPDVHMLDVSLNDFGGSEAIKINYIRQLQKDIALRPYEGKTKVFILDNAHNLTAPASNAILKILEEPPGNSLIILITSKPALLLKTIISRCQVLKFSPLKRIELKGLLKADYSLNENLAHFLAYFCEGRIGCALRLKDADILEKKNMVIDEFISPGRARLENFSVTGRDEFRGYLNILASWFRDIYLIKIGSPHSGLINLDRKNELLRSMGHYSFLDLDEILHTISESLLYIGQNVNIRLLLGNLKVALQE